MATGNGTPEAANGSGTVADAYTGNWVDRYAPAPLRPYFRLSRLDRPIGTWLLLLPCWWGLLLGMGFDGRASWHDLWIAVGCAIGGTLMRGAGCTWNDITDRHIDGSVARTRSRPIPSGAVSVPQALAWLVVQALIAFFILITFDTAAIILGIVALAPVAIYPFAKRFHSMPQAHLGLAFAWGIPMAWAAATGSVHWPLAAPLMAATVVWAIAYDSFYALVDVEDDEKIGVRSSARLFGRRATDWIAVFQALTLLLMVWVGQIAGLGRYYMAALIAAGALSLWQQWLARTQGRDGCFRAFLNNHPLGFLILAGLVLDLSA